MDGDQIVAEDKVYAQEGEDHEIEDIPKPAAEEDKEVGSQRDGIVRDQEKEVVGEGKAHSLEDDPAPKEDRGQGKQQEYNTLPEEQEEVLPECDTESTTKPEDGEEPVEPGPASGDKPAAAGSEGPLVESSPVSCRQAPRADPHTEGGGALRGDAGGDGRPCVGPAGDQDSRGPAAGSWLPRPAALDEFQSASQQQAPPGRDARGKVSNTQQGPFSVHSSNLSLHNSLHNNSFMWGVRKNYQFLVHFHPFFWRFFLYFVYRYLCLPTLN